MKLSKLTSLAAMLLLPVSLSAQVTTSTLINSSWQFHAGNDINPESTVDASTWRTLDLPHDFQLGQPWVAPSADEKADNNDAGANIKSRLSSRGFKEMGIGWYRKVLNVPAEMKGRRVLLDFEGIMYNGDVYLNGKRVGGTDYGYVGFEIDITKDVKYGQDNVILVKADTREPLTSRWYTGGGIFRDVHLVSTPAGLYFKRHPLYITTSQNKTLNIQAGIGSTVKQDTMRFEVTILNPQGMEVYKNTYAMKRHRQQREEEINLPAIDMTTAFNDAAGVQLWDCEHPNLYTAKVAVYDMAGNVADETQATFGVRTVEIIPDRGLLLNGKKVYLKGYANHHTLGALGAAVYPDAIEKRIKLIKQFGMNHIRTSHNPYSTSFLDLCDKYGILVVDELYDKWLIQYCGGRGDFASLWQYDLPEWIQRDRNHPSVVMWSFGNELQQYATLPFNDWGVTQYKLMRELTKRYDSSRLTTVAMHPRYRNLDTDSLPCDLAMETDVQSYNYRYMYFPGDAKRFPHMKFYQSEASVAAMGPNFFEQNSANTIGLAYWGAIDYLGESNGWPAKGWENGVFDISLEPKPKAYFMKSMFDDAPMVHVGIIDKKGDLIWNGVQVGNEGMSENWNRTAGSDVNLITYTNCDEVELLLNGKSIGKKKNSTDPKSRNQIRWNGIKYAEGTLEAVGYKDGKATARHKIETTGTAAVLKANIEDNGSELIHVRITAVDKKGRRVVFANNDVKVTVSGDAELIGMDNGDIYSDELHTADHRTLHNGSILAIIRKGTTGNRDASGKASPLTITATANGLKTAVLKIK